MRKKAKNKFVPHSDRGFTLVEVMISICILGVGLLAVANMQVNSIDGNTLSSNTTAALNLAEDRMEDLLQRTWTATATDANLIDTTAANNGVNIGSYADNALDSITITDNVENNLDATGTLNGQAGGSSFSRITNIADNTPTADTKTICVIVTWQNNNKMVRVCCTRRRS